MKVLPFKIPKPDFDALIFQEDKGHLFYDKLHQHEEIQISLIIEGEGTLIVGDTINYYKTGDVLVIGSHIPHVFKSDQTSNLKSHMLTLFFTETSFGVQFFDLEELKELKPFFKRSKHGFKVSSHKKVIGVLFEQLESASKLKRFIILLELLQLLSKSGYTSLSSFIYNKMYTDIEGHRMRDVFEYTMNHFNEDISLTTISEVANMTKNAFCKYFKKRTNKTYITFLNELRVEHACKLLLVNKDMPIVDIAEMTGFRNISNFNRQFKSVKMMSPSVFKALKTTTVF
ncbi:AraC family transcriptional regulator [Psychroserpens luteolus]|uniref:AraC family transcriptional regulator n=1 Tax=Psychroserpens luteolus TaxID=2855840 RepID=UPI001E61EFA4|nr:AraC family transcriptional regulator [Psychroserpens luteolus]MCD2257839.1 AraC family transcriptional regulator [Psychroserpens luteolus]